MGRTHHVGNILTRPIPVQSLGSICLFSSLRRVIAIAIIQMAVGAIMVGMAVMYITYTLPAGMAVTTAFMEAVGVMRAALMVVVSITLVAEPLNLS